MVSISVVNMVPLSSSNEAFQDCEPNLSVNYANPLEIVGTAFTPDDPNSSVMVGALAPVYISTDGGATWSLSKIIPSAIGSHYPTGDITVRFSSTSGTLYGGILKAPSFTASLLRTTSVTTPMTELVTADADQPFVHATTVLGPVWSTDIGKDRVYIGYNAGSGGDSAIIQESLDAATAPAPAGFQPEGLDTRSTGTAGQDGPSVRVAIHPDGIIYAAFFGWRSSLAGNNFSSDIVVVRDDNWASGPNPFKTLVDPGDGLAGLRVVQSTTIPFRSSLQSDFGHDRFGSDLAIAVDPGNSQRVYIAWSDGTSSTDYTLHVRYSHDSGATWSPDVRTLVKAKNPGLAINSRGVVGLLCQQVTGATGSERWITHFERSTNNFTTSDDFVLATVSAESPSPDPQYGTYIGDYAGLQAVGKDFYGIFAASNYPDTANFPQGVTYQRNVDFTAHQLRSLNGLNTVAVSIDPFFFKVIEEAVGSDFYVRDWTDTPTSGDNGVEPSTHANFFSTSDVWNQRSSNIPTAPNVNDQPVNEDPTSGSGAQSSNYAFARIRRNTPASAGSAPITVTAHFLVSEFGTGSNFTDAITVDPTDPDVFFTAPDPTVTFNPAELGPKVTPAYPWTLGPTTSTHLCLAVEISTPDDPYVRPGLSGHAPGWPGSDLAITLDNNKAQRNMQVYHAMSGLGAVASYALVHNAATFPRDVTLNYGAPAATLAQLQDAVLEVIDPQGKTYREPFSSGATLILPRMQPGENRWVGLTVGIAQNARDVLPVTFTEVVGSTALNGFTIAAQPAALSTVIEENVAFHSTVFARMATAFHIAGALEESVSAQHLLGDDSDNDSIIVEEEIVIVEETASSIVVVEEEVFQEKRSSRRKHHISDKRYARFLREHIHAIQEYVTALLTAHHIDDAFTIQETLAQLETTLQTSDGSHAAAIHTALLHKLDASFTMIQKTKGDRADILQTLFWQNALYTALPQLQMHGLSSHLLQETQQFIQAYEARKKTSADYPELIKVLLPTFHKTAKALEGVDFHLQPAILEIEHSLQDVTALQKGHRSYLLQLQSLSQ